MEAIRAGARTCCGSSPATLAGLTAPKTYAYFFGAPAINDETGVASRPLDDTAPRLKRDARRDRWLVAVFHAGAVTAAFAFGFGVE